MKQLPELSVWPVRNPDIWFKRYDRSIELIRFCVSRDRAPITVKAKLCWMLMGVIECNKR